MGLTWGQMMSDAGATLFADMVFASAGGTVSCTIEPDGILAVPALSVAGFPSRRSASRGSLRALQRGGALKDRLLLHGGAPVILKTHLRTSILCHRNRHPVTESCGL